MDYADIFYGDNKKKYYGEKYLFGYNYPYLHINKTHFVFSNLPALMSDIIIRITI